MSVKIDGDHRQTAGQSLVTKRAVLRFTNTAWNLCTTDKFEGYVFGWLHWQAKHFTDKNFQILFWTINPRSERVLVGAYLGASLATRDELLRLHSFFEKADVNKRRLFEVFSVVPASQKSYVMKHPPTKAKDLRFKCPVDKVKIFQPQIFYNAMPKRFRSRNARFKNPTIIEESVDELLRAAFSKPRPGKAYAVRPFCYGMAPTFAIREALGNFSNITITAGAHRQIDGISCWTRRLPRKT